MLAESLRLTSELQASENEISIQFGVSSTATDTTVILKRANQLDGGNFEEIYRFDTSDQRESMARHPKRLSPTFQSPTNYSLSSAYYKVSAE